ncbi:hypothetical protein BDF22DRAFT_700596 [Syncephalis plumigaleata]|nr:hypothetical protein BDF22DRAFT_700596 [Syncephalis plumigaleata]
MITSANTNVHNQHTLKHVTLTADRLLLNPQFDGYQLSILPEQTLQQQLLPHPVEPVLLSNQVDITYGEMRSRALVNGGEEQLFYYVDSEDWLMAIRITKSVAPDTVSIEPLFHMDTTTSLSSTHQPHYPSVVSYGSWLVLSNGRGQLYLLEWLGERGTSARLVDSWIHDTSDTAMGRPCTLLDMIASLLNNSEQSTLSDSVDGSNASVNTSGIYRNKRATEDTQKQTAKHFTMPVCRLAHQIVSREPSVYAYFHEPNVYVVGGRVPWTSIQADDIASTMPTDVIINDNNAPSSAVQPSYTWTQTESDQELTLYIVLDRPVLPQQIQCEFTATTIHLDIMDGLDPLLWMQHRTLYDRIIPTECLWTLESGRLLTLHLQREGKSTGGASRWPHVFAEDDGVLETLDPSVLAEIRDQMAKLTSQYPATGTGASPYQPMVTHVLSDPPEAEDEEGDSISFYLDSITIMTHCIKSGTQDWLALGTRPSLNIDIATSTASVSIALPAICLRQDIDGLVYELGGTSTCSDHEGDLHTRHAATFDAFGFVQASKRDRRFSLFSSHAQYMVIVEVCKQ